MTALLGYYNSIILKIPHAGFNLNVPQRRAQTTWHRIMRFSLRQVYHGFLDSA